MQNQVRLCSYVAVYDRGLAPNPFWDYCTMAVCTPNHMGIRLQKRDWIAGFTSAARGNKLLHAMQVSEVLSFDEYYQDPRFSRKKPNVKGPWQEQCGDNMYFLGADRKYKQTQTRFHRSPADRDKDLKHPHVFVAQHFYYFGENARSITEHDFRAIIWPRRGCSCKHSPDLVAELIKWLSKFEPGIHGNPIDRSGQALINLL